MKLKEMRLKNFRCYEDLTVPLHEQLTVLVAPNGQGKTSILHAIIMLLDPYIEALRSQRTRLQIDERNIRLIPDTRQKSTSFVPMTQQLPCCIYAKNTQDTIWHLTLEHNQKNNKNLDTIYNGNIETNDEIENLLNLARQIADNDQKITTTIQQLPLFAFYGVNRGLGVNEHSGLIKQKQYLEDTRYFAYHQCFNDFSNYNNAFNWFISLYDKLKAEAFERLELGEQISLDDLNSEFTLVIQDVVNTMLANVGWGNIRTQTQTYSRYSQVVLTHKDIGSLEEWRLSEGIRSVLGMVMDIAYRCCILNSHLGENAVKETEGIVLIDEVDMHLHPAWQQTILQDLQTAFPKLQFIVTTHSPQVLSTIKKEHIRILKDGELVELNDAIQTYGELSSDVLYTVMEVNPRPPIPERQDLDELTRLVDSGLYNDPKVREGLDKVTIELGENAEAVKRIKRSIQRQQRFAELKGQEK
ncbi:AAA family ATPase [Neisseria cinerea]|uniref:AAA family ATPase n=1 Tax=Neisseria cinerea TaxID=483 RepID=UPI000D3AF120|nr:AAA family ATPase [Neisseria cinerea]